MNFAPRNEVLAPGQVAGPWAPVPVNLYGMEGLVYTYVVGNDLSALRPEWPGRVEWLVSVPGGEPVNAIEGDLIGEYPAENPPVFTDNFERANGPLGVTDTGDLTWATQGAASWGVRANRAQIVTSGAGATYAFVRPGVSRGVFQATVTSQTTSFHAAVCFRYQDDANCYILARTSGTDFTTRLVKRISGTQAGSLTLTGHQINAGTVIRIDDSTVGALKVYFNDVLAYDEATATMKATELTSADGVGLYLGAGDAPLGAATWDDLTFWGA